MHQNQILDGLRRCSETIQNLILMYKLIQIHGIFLHTSSPIPPPRPQSKTENPGSAIDLYSDSQSHVAGHDWMQAPRERKYRSGTVNSKFHLIRSCCEIFVYNCPNISCLKYTVNSKFHLIQSKTLPTNDFELTVPDL